MKLLVACFLSLFISVSLQAQKKDKLFSHRAPDIVFQHCLNKNIPLQFYKGKILVIDFWATWCAPCIAGFPHYNALANKFSGNDVIFAAITDEPSRTVQKFFNRTKKHLSALLLIDTSEKTKKAFNILYIPHTVIIDKNDIVRWSGESSELTDAMLSRIIKNESVSSANSQTALSVNIPNKPLDELAFFSFEAAKSDTGRSAPESNMSYKTYFSAITDLSSLNNPLIDIIGLITNYSTARIITNNDLKIKQHIDLAYKTGHDTSRFRDYTNAVFRDEPIKNYVICTLGDAFKFRAKIVSQKRMHYELVIADTAKLHTFESMQSKHSSFSDDYFPRFEIVHYNLKDIATQLENSAKIIITTNIKDNNMYDLSLNISDIETMNKGLLFHGLRLIEVNDEVKLLYISFY